MSLFVLGGTSVITAALAVGMPVQAASHLRRVFGRGVLTSAKVTRISERLAQGTLIPGKPDTVNNGLVAGTWVVAMPHRDVEVPFESVGRWGQIVQVGMEVQVLADPDTSAVIQELGPLNFDFKRRRAADA